MKKFFGIFLIIIMTLFGLAACNSGSTDDGGKDDETGGVTEIGGNGDKTEPSVLIAYFSCTNTTEAIAKHIEAETKGVLYEIVPAVPYTADDLRYYTDCRADREQADANARPAINGSVTSMEKYGTVFIGYPIWHGQAPKIVYTFLESYDFSGKRIIPFCTSGSSGIGSSATNLHSLAPSAEWDSGRRFSSGTSRDTVAGWIDSLNIESERSADA